MPGAAVQNVTVTAVVGQTPVINASVSTTKLTTQPTVATTPTSQVDNVRVTANANSATQVSAQALAAGPRGRDGSGSGDMVASIYDPNNKSTDAFSMSNMVETTTKKVMTSAERSKLDDIAEGATANSDDVYLLARSHHTGTQTASTISDFSTAVNAVSNVASNTAARHTHSNKTILDNTTASFTTADETKLDDAVTGPGSSTDSNVAVFDGTDGETVREAPVSIDSDGYILTNSGIESTSVMGAPNGFYDEIEAYTESGTVTVDGRVVSVDGTKLDGIEGGAQVNTVDSVNSKTGTVTLDPDDLDDTSTTNKFVTSAEKTILANTSGTNTGDQDLSGLVPKTTTVNGHALSSNITLTPGDVLPSQTGNSGKYLTTDGSNASWGSISGSGSGDVTGPSSSTDNAVARFDSTTGKIIQESAVTISDLGIVDGVDSISVSDVVATDNINEYTTGAGVTADGVLLKDGKMDASYVSGTLGVGNGGTGRTSHPSGNYLVGNGSGTIQNKTPSAVLTDIGAEATANKSTSTSLGTSDTLFPTQKAVKTYVDNALTITDYTASISFSSGWSSSTYVLIKYGRMAWLSGFFSKSSNIANADVAMTLPSAVFGITAAGAAIYTVAQAGATDKVARINIDGSNGQVVVRNPSASMTNLAFSLMWITAS